MSIAILSEFVGEKSNLSANFCQKQIENVFEALWGIIHQIVTP